MSDPVGDPGLEAFAAELCCVRVADAGAALVARARPAVAAARDATVRLGSLGLVAGLAVLLEEPGAGLSGLRLPLDVRRYDDRVVGPLVVDRRLRALADAYTGLPARLRGLGIALLGERVADAVEPDRPWWAPGALRGWLALPDDDAWSCGLRGLSDAGVLARLQARLGAVQRTAGFSAADVHLLRHLPVLTTRAQRVAVRQLIDAAAVLDGALPRHVRPRPRPGRVSSRAHEEGAFPAGGFAGLTTSGSPENLVASELVYLEPGADLDLFDVRYAEGELLYYTRDEAIHARPRRTVVIGLAADLTDARVKDEGADWQRIVYLLAVLVAVVGRLVRWLGHVELRILVQALDGDARELEDELGLLSLALRSYVEAGVVELAHAPPATFGAALEEARQRGETDVVFASTAAAPPVDDADIRLLAVGAYAPAAWGEVATALAWWLA